MENPRYISYADWMALIAKIIDRGTSCEEFEKLKIYYPQAAGEVYNPMIYNELAKLETCMLQRMFTRFQKAMVNCLEEADIEIAVFAIRNLKRSLRDCLFFNGVPEYSESVKEGINAEIGKNMRSFQQEYLKYLKKLSYSDSSEFVQDLVYICMKCDFNRVIQESVRNGQLR